MDKQHYLLKGVIGLFVYLIATGLSFAVFTYVGKKPQAVTTPQSEVATEPGGIDPSIPKTEPCPINGMLYTKQERDIWETRRPLAVMIENHSDARPQSGLSKADVVYEAVAEGGITRFMGVFYCGAAYQNTLLAPVRSARTYFLPWVLEYDAGYVHVGGAGNCNDDTVDERAKALCQIQQWKIKDMDQFGLPFKAVADNGQKVSVCYRNYDRLDHPVATEHTMVCETNGLYQVAKDRDWTNVDENKVAWDKNFTEWKFKDDADPKDRGASFSASFVAWSGYANDYGVKWTYDPGSNTYARFNGGVPHVDLNTGKQLTAKDVIILFAKQTGPVDDHKHLLYADVGTGTGLVFEDGKTIKMDWKKPERTSRTRFYDQTTGKEIPLNRGQIWIEMLPTGTTITY